MEITGKTRLTGLIGSPVAHSISPQMHNEAFRLLGLDYVYLAFDLGHSSLRQAVEGLREIGCRGFNVTMPYKVPILEFMDELTPAARIAGACNTVIIKDGRMTGHTTDGVGFMQSVTDAGHNIFRKKMTILGAGGAAAPHHQVNAGGSGGKLRRRVPVGVADHHHQVARLRLQLRLPVFRPLPDVAALPVVPVGEGHILIIGLASAVKSLPLLF